VRTVGYRLRQLYILSYTVGNRTSESCEDFWV